MGSGSVLLGRRGLDGDVQWVVWEQGQGSG